MDEDLKAQKEKLKALLDELKKGHSDAWLAEQLGVSAYAVNSWSRGTTPTVDSLQKIATYMGMTLGELMVKLKGNETPQELPTSAVQAHRLLTALNASEKLKLIRLIINEMLD